MPARPSRVVLWNAVALLLLAVAQVVSFEQAGWNAGIVGGVGLVALNLVRAYGRRA